MSYNHYNINHNPPPKPKEDACPTPPKPFSNIGVLGVTFIIFLISNVAFRYIYLRSQDAGVHTILVCLGALIFALCIGVYLSTAQEHLKKKPPTPGLGAFEVGATVFFQIILFAATYAGASALFKG